MKMWSYLLALISFILFGILLSNFDKQQFVMFDEKMADLLGNNKFIIFFHYFGETAVIVTVAIILLIFLLVRERNYRAMMFVLLTIAGGNILNRFVKNWVERPRPEVVDQLTSYSFPSGHAMLGLLYLCTIAYLLSEILNSDKKVLLTWTFMIVLTVLVGLSRIAETHHYATDVLAGWFLGYSWFIICVYWYEGRTRKFKRFKKI